MCLVLEYNWNYPRSEVTKTAPSPGLVTLTQVTVTRVYPRMQPSIAPHFTAKRVWDNLQIFPLHKSRFLQRTIAKMNANMLIVVHPSFT